MRIDIGVGEGLKLRLFWSDTALGAVFEFNDWLETHPRFEVVILEWEDSRIAVVYREPE